MVLKYEILLFVLISLLIVSAPIAYELGVQVGFQEAMQPVEYFAPME